MNGGKIKNNITFLLIIVFIIVGYFLYKTSGFSFSPYYAKDLNHPSIDILVVGDIMLDRNVRHIINKIGFDKFFSGVEGLVKRADIAVGNLEGPFTTYPSVTADLPNKALQFTFSPALAPKLAELGFDILGLANNHTLNFGREGLEMTRRYIGSSGMMYYGDPFNKDEISTAVTKDGIKVAFVGFHEFYYVNFPKVFEEIKRLRREVDVLVVTPHWGNEYQKEPTEKMIKWAHEFIDSGADAVIGTHPHVVGISEKYKGKKIYYSLGNFVFDQYFSEETMNGLAIVINVTKKDNKIELDYEEIPVMVDRGGVGVLIEPDKSF